MILQVGTGLHLQVGATLHQMVWNKLALLHLHDVPLLHLDIGSMLHLHDGTLLQLCVLALLHLHDGTWLQVHERAYLHVGDLMHLHVGDLMHLHVGDLIHLHVRNLCVHHLLFNAWLAGCRTFTNFFTLKRFIFFIIVLCVPLDNFITVNPKRHLLTFRVSCLENNLVVGVSFGNRRPLCYGTRHISQPLPLQNMKISILSE